MTRRLVLINPNATQRVTDDISVAVEPLRSADLDIACETLAGGPPGVLTQRDADLLIGPLLDWAERGIEGYDGIVVACYSDPGVHSLREILDVPVFGAAQATLGYAAAIGCKAGVISLRSASVARHNAAARASDLAGIVAGDRAADVSIADLGADEVLEKLLLTARDLIEKDGAEILILGCCGMSRFARAVAAEIGTTVLDPSLVAAAAARTAIIGGFGTPPRGGRP